MQPHLRTLSLIGVRNRTVTDRAANGAQGIQGFPCSAKRGTETKASWTTSGRRLSVRLVRAEGKTQPNRKRPPRGFALWTNSKKGIKGNLWLLLLGFVRGGTFSHTPRGGRVRPGTRWCWLPVSPSPRAPQPKPRTRQRDTLARSRLLAHRRYPRRHARFLLKSEKENPLKT